MKKLLTVFIVVVIVAASAAGAYTYLRKAEAKVEVSTALISRGDIVQTVGATGALEATRTVDIGSQVSGTIKELYADFNDMVRKGQVVARLDPALLETTLEQQKANLTRAEADLERLRVSLEDSKTKLQRAEELSTRKLIPLEQLETARIAVRTLEMQIKSSLAGLEQAKAQVSNAQKNVDLTVITSPIDGIVILRNFEVGQTVAASMNAPVIFKLAMDLTRMQVRASVDEADVGLIRAGQRVRFRVDAYPNEEFIGSVSQVRLSPVVVQNVVTYVTVIEVANQQYKLKPGMTANVTIEIARRDNALRVPNSVLRFRATQDIFAALNQEVPADMQRGRRGEGMGPNGQGGNGRPANGGGQTAGAPAGSPSASQPGRGGQSGQPTPPAAANAPAQRAGAPGQGERPAGGPPSAEGAGRRGEGGGTNANLSPEERRARFAERMQNLSPADREQMMQRFQERGGGQGPGGFGPARQPAAPTLSAANAQTIDSLFGPLQFPETRARVWQYLNKQLKGVSLRLGITDGTFTEVLGDPLPVGTELVTNVSTGQPQGTTTGGPGAPFPGMPGQRPGMGFPGGGGRR